MFSNPRKLLNTKLKKGSTKTESVHASNKLDTGIFRNQGSEPMWPYHCKVISFPLPARAPV